MTFNRRERTIAVTVFLLAATLLLDRFVISPGIQDWKTFDARLARAEKDLDLARRTLARESAVQARWKALEARLAPEPIEDVLHFADHLWGLASTAGTSFQRLEPLKHVEARGDYSELSYEVSLRCTIRHLNRFLYELDASPEILKVRTLRVTSRSGSPVLDCDLQISTLEPAASPAPRPK